MTSTEATRPINAEDLSSLHDQLAALRADIGALRELVAAPRPEPAKAAEQFGRAPPPPEAKPAEAKPAEAKPAEAKPDELQAGDYVRARERIDTTTGQPAEKGDLGVIAHAQYGTRPLVIVDFAPFHDHLGRGDGAPTAVELAKDEAETYLNANPGRRVVVERVLKG